MQRNSALCHHNPNRRGHTLIMFALFLPLLLGMVGVAIDSGLLLATYRQTQNAADAAATAAALDLINQLSVATAKTTGATYVQTYNNMASATVTINIPPLSGPHTGSSSYAEALVSYPYKTSFIQFLGIKKNQSVTARSVAGYYLAAADVIALQPGGSGISVTGGSVLSVNGAITDNATSSTALSVNNGGDIYATSVSVAGTASIAGGSSVANYPSGGGTSPLTQHTGVDVSDPLANMPVPTTSNGVTNTNYGTLTGSGTAQTLVSSGSTPTSGGVNVNNGHTAILQPGIYQSINVAGGSSVTFQPGIYVLAGGGMNISNGATINGSGVMFYNTSSKYNATTGADGSGGTFGSLTIVGGSTLNLTGMSSSSSSFSGVLIFQDRANTNTLTLNNGSSISFTGTVYAPTANLLVQGGATYNAPFIVGSFTTNNGARITINPPGGSTSAYADKVFLVE